MALQVTGSLLRQQIHHAARQHVSAITGKVRARTASIGALRNTNHVLGAELGHLEGLDRRQGVGGLGEGDDSHARNQGGSNERKCEHQVRAAPGGGTSLGCAIRCDQNHFCRSSE